MMSVTCTVKGDNNTADSLTVSIGRDGRYKRPNERRVVGGNKRGESDSTSDGCVRRVSPVSINLFPGGQQYGDVKFRIQIGSNWPQMGQIWDFLRSVSVHFGAQICPILGQSDPIWIPNSTSR